MKRKVILWVFSLSVAFLLGSVVAAIPLYKLALTNRPPTVFGGGGEQRREKISGSCVPSEIEWMDAVYYEKDTPPNLNKNWREFLAKQTSFGCVAEKDNVVMVFFNFSENKPDTYLCIPKDWVIRVHPLSPSQKKGDEQ